MAYLTHEELCLLVSGEFTPEASISLQQRGYPFVSRVVRRVVLENAFACLRLCCSCEAVLAWQVVFQLRDPDLWEEPDNMLRSQLGFRDVGLFILMSCCDGVTKHGSLASLPLSSRWTDPFAACYSCWGFGMHSVLLSSDRLWISLLFLVAWHCLLGTFCSFVP